MPPAPVRVIEPGRVQERDEFHEVLVAADEAGEANRQIADRRSGDTQRRELRAKARDVELEQLLGQRDVLERDPAQAANPDVGRQARLDEGAGRPGQDDLATVADRRDTGRAVDVEAAVIVAREVGLARVEPHPHPDRGIGGPGVGGERPLRIHRRRDAGRRLLERREQGVALGPHAHAAIRGHGGTQHVQMGLIDVVPRRTQLAGQAHRTFDIRAQEGDGAGRQVAPVGRSVDHGRQPTAG